MKKQVARLDEYKEKMEEYKRLKRSILKEPEEKCHELADDLNIYEMRRQIESDVTSLTKKAWNLYKKIWNGRPDKSDVDKFITLADQIMKYEEFISADMMKVWKVSRDLIWAFGQSYQQQEIL